MALSKRITAFAGVVLFLSLISAAYLIGVMRGSQNDVGNTNEPQTNATAFQPRERLERTPNLNLSQRSLAPQNPVFAPFQQPIFGQGDPFAQMQADMQAMQERMNNLFGHAAMGIGQDLGGGFGLQELGVEERDGAYVFNFQAQGLDQGSLKVRVDDGQLSVSGEYAQDLGNMKTSSSFSRMSSLPGPVDAASLKTDYKDGVLTITVNKQPSRIQRDHTAQRGGGLPH